ncbi:MAG: hypothetical protein K2X28_06060 [Alphaproteobacteria bacterium]|nr:hypothetical protein [Alphaproteobacteria bacterium]
MSNRYIFTNLFYTIRFPGSRCQAAGRQTDGKAIGYTMPRGQYRSKSHTPLTPRGPTTGSISTKTQRTNFFNEA